MIIFVGAVKIIDGEDESWKPRIIHSKIRAPDKQRICVNTQLNN